MDYNLSLWTQRLVPGGTEHVTCRVDVGIMGRLLLWVKHFLGHHKTCGSNYSVLRLSFVMEW